MKIKSYLGMIALGALFASCNGGGSSAELNSESTPADSMIYYFGQLRGADFKRDAMGDSVLNSEAGRNAYLQGVKAGLEAMQEDNDAYNKGFNLGMRVAMETDNFAKEFGVTINKHLFLNSMREQLSTDSVADVQKLQNEFYRMMSQIRDSKSEKDREESKVSLAEDAKKLGLPKITDNLYGKITKTTNGEALKAGDHVKIELEMKRPDGSTIDLPFPKEGEIGSRVFVEPVAEALQKMKSGESGEYVTSAFAIFKQNVTQVGLTAKTPVTFTLKAELLPKED